MPDIDVKTRIAADGSLLRRMAGTIDDITLANLAADPAFFGAYHFVALPTGTAATDTANIQAALTAARTAGGGVVKLQPGTYKVNLSAHPSTGDPYYAALVIGANTHLEGAGKNATIIQVANSQGVAAKSNHVILNYTIGAGGDENITVSDLTVDGNNANQTTIMFGVSVMRARSVLFERVRCLNLRGTAVSGANENFYFEFSLSTDGLVVDCEAVCTGGSSSSGFSADSSSNIKWIGCVARGMSVANGFTHNTCRNLQYVGCHSYLNTYVGFNSEVSQDVIWTNCIAGGTSVAAATYPYASGTTLGNTTQPGFTINGTTGFHLVGVVSRMNSEGVHITNSAAGEIVGGLFNDNLYGIGFGDAASQLTTVITGSPVVTGNTNEQIAMQGAVNVDPPNPSITAPSIPATTVALANPYPFNCWVYVAGGTVTVIAVSGVTTGMTSGPIWVPAGSSITLTYSSAPTWTWATA